MRLLRGLLPPTVVLWAICALSGGCGSQAPQPQLAPAVGAQSATGPLALPPPSRVAGGTSVDDDHKHFLHGADYAAELPCNRISVSGEDMLFSPSWSKGAEQLDGLAYAMFEFSLEGCDEPEPTLFLSWQNPQPAASTCFVGLGDQVRDCWVWHALDAGQVLQIGDNSPYIGDNNSMILTVAVSATGTYGLQWMRWGEDQEPFAQLSAYPKSGKPPLTVSFNASTSEDFDGTIVDYLWDLDGDGNYGEAGDEAAGAGQPTATYTYTQEGFFNAAVRVIDDCDVHSVATVEIDTTSEAGWTVVTVDDTNNVEQALSLKVVDGHPAIAYAANGWLMYARSSSVTGEQEADWSSPVTVDNAGDVGPYCSLAVVDGQPAISYMRFDNGLRYTRATTADGDGAGEWSPPLKLYTSAAELSMAVIDGHPAVVFRSSKQVLYQWSSTTTGSQLADWDYPVLIDVFS